MNRSTKHLLELLSKQCSTQLTYYMYNKNIKSQKYQKGQLCALHFVQELNYYFFQKEKALKNEYLNKLSTELENVRCLNDGDYKDGLIDALNKFISAIKEQ